MLYSQLKSTGKSTRIITKCAQNNWIQLADFEFDFATGLPNVIQSIEQAESIGWSGTIVKMKLPKTFAKPALNNVVTALQIYFFRTHLYPTNISGINFEVNLMSAHTSKPRTRLAHEYKGTPKIVSLEAQSCPDTFRQNILQKFTESLTDTEKCDHCSVTFENDDQGNELKVAALLVTSAIPFEGITKPEQFQIQIWRYVNGTPLVDFVNDAVSCCLFRSAIGLRWSEYGHQFKIQLPQAQGGTGHDSQASADTYLASQDTLEWCLAPLRDVHLPFETDPLKPKILVLILDYISTDGTSYIPNYKGEYTQVISSILCI